jgi:Fic family protein
MNDRYITFDWNGRVAKAWIPPLLTDRHFALPEPTVRATERALAELRLMEQRLVPAAEPIGRLLLRSEGIASSAIEGLSVPVEELLTVEALGDGAAAATWVAGNLSAAAAAVADAATLPVRSLDFATLHGWHRQLTAGSGLDAALHGAWRSSSGWIGGASPLDAVYVPPPADRIPDLMSDLMRYINATEPDPITQAAVAHAQFETIHPYGDGNGRIGRVLVGWILRRRRAVDRYPPPVSVTMLRDAGGYLSGLYEFREGDPTRWIDWFAARTTAAATAAGELYQLLSDLTGSWRASLSNVRTDSVAHRIVDLLPCYPVISAAQVAADCGVSRRAALTGLELLESRGLLTEFEAPSRGRGRPTRWWIATDLATAVQRWMG